MSLEDCISCVKKAFIYTGNSCVYSLKNQKHSENEIDAATTKVDCVVSYKAVDNGNLSIGLSTKGETILCFTLLALVILYLVYERIKGTKLAKDLEDIFKVMLASGFFPKLAAIRGANDGPFKTALCSLADKMRETMQNKANKAMAERSRKRQEKWQKQVQKQRLQQQQQHQRGRAPGLSIQEIEEDAESVDSFRSSVQQHQVIEIQAQVHPAILN